MSELTVRPATEGEAPACLALLPGLRAVPAELLIARRSGELAGAAGVVWRNGRDMAAFPLQVEVVPAARRQGVGRRLVAAAEALVRGETGGLASAQPLDRTGDAAAFARACGFTETRLEHHFRAEVGRVVQYARPLVARLRARGRIPDDVRILPLREAPLEEVGWLVSAEFGGGPESALAFLRGAGAAGAVDHDRSLAVMQGPQVAGVILGRFDDDGLVIEASIVAAAWRGGWANAAMIEAMAAIAEQSGADTFRFHCDDRVLDTMKVATRTDAVREATAALYYRAVTS